MDIEYTVYLINKQKRVLGEVRSLAQGLKIKKALNVGDTIDFEMDYDQFQQHIGQNSDPRAWLVRGATDIVVFRNGKPFAVSRLATWQPKITANAIKIVMKGEPLINFYADQYITTNFNVDTPQGEIVWQVINACNLKPNGDYNIRKGDNVAMFPRQRNETDKQVKDFITRLTRVRKGLDFEIVAHEEIMNGAYTKYINTYDIMGVYHRNENWIYPDDDGIKDFDIDVGDEVYNAIIGYGSGNGDAAIRHFEEDDASQQMYYRREKLVTYNSIVNLQLLIENVQGVLDGVKAEIELPKFIFNHGRLDLERIRVGDSVNAKAIQNKLFNISGVYRIIEINVDVSDEDVETPSVIFDNYNIDDIIEQQDDADD